MKNSVTFISASIFPSDNGAQKRQKFNLCEGLELVFDDEEFGIKFRRKLRKQAKTFRILARGVQQDVL